MSFRPMRSAHSATFHAIGGDQPSDGWVPHAMISAATVQAVSHPEPEVEDEADAPQVGAEELAALIEAAREEGRELGRAEAQLDLAVQREHLREEAEALLPVLEQLEALRRETLERAAEDVAELVLLFSRRVVDRSLALHPDALPQLVLGAVAQLPNREQVVISVAPHLAERLTRNLPPGLRDRVVADPAIENGATVRTQHVSIEATLQTATEALEKAVKSWLSEQWWAVGDGEFG